MEDIKLRLECDCHYPWHFIWFEFDPETVWTKAGGKTVKGQPELTVMGEFFHGRLWQRIKSAWKYIIRSEYTTLVDVAMFGDEPITKLHAFCHDCMELLVAKDSTHAKE